MAGSRLNVIVVRGCAILTVCLSGICPAQSFPNKPIRFVVGFPAGGGADITARLVSDRLTKSLGQPMVVENRPGASTAIATDFVAKSPADGHTMLLMSSSTVIQSTLRTDLPYDLVRDLAPVSAIARGAFVLVLHPSVPSRNVQDFIALAKSNGKILTYASDGVGSAFHLAMELFFSIGKIKGVTHVPYKGGAAAATAVASGQTDMSIIGIAGALPLMSSNKLKGIAVTTANRAALLPQLPTLEESGIHGYDRSTWYGAIVPARVSKDIVARLNSEIGSVLRLPDVKESLRRLGLESMPNTPEQFAAYIKDELAKNAALTKSIGLRHE